MDESSSMPGKPLKRGISYVFVHILRTNVIGFFEFPPSSDKSLENMVMILEVSSRRNYRSELHPIVMGGFMAPAQIRPFWKIDNGGNPGRPMVGRQKRYGRQ